MSQDGRGLDPATRTEGEGETLDMPEGFEPFTPGQVLGERYQILEMLGRGSGDTPEEGRPDNHHVPSELAHSDSSGDGFPGGAETAVVPAAGHRPFGDSVRSSPRSRQAGRGATAV